LIDLACDRQNAKWIVNAVLRCASKGVKLLALGSISKRILICCYYGGGIGEVNGINPIGRRATVRIIVLIKYIVQPMIEA
jgi:hypothetical protein